MGALCTTSARCRSLHSYGEMSNKTANAPQEAVAASTGRSRQERQEDEGALRAALAQLCDSAMRRALLQCNLHGSLAVHAWGYLQR
jgi:hypothetical protein